MNVFRFCRQGLTALPVFLVFTACDKLLPTSGNGELVPVKIRSVSVKGYGEASATRSAGGEKRIVGQPIVRDLGGGMLAEITVEEDVEALRDATQLGSDSPVKFRVIAVNSSDDKVYSYADYTAGSDAINRDGGTPDLHVLSGGSYYFVCISYNNTTLPPAPALNATLGAVSVTAGNDLLWQTISNPQTDSDGVPVLEFKELKHRLAVVKLFFDAQSASKTISSVDNSKITLGLVGTEGSFSLAGGTVSNITASNTLPFGGWGATGSQTLASGEIRFIPQATGDYTLTIAKDAVTFSGSQTTAAQTIPVSCSKFVAGSRYTIQLKVLPDTRIGYFAGALTKNASGVWKFTKELYVQNADAEIDIPWSTDDSNTQGGTDDTHGKANTLALYNSSYENPAAELCFQKNTYYASITATSDADYIWYLPAFNQLMAIWAVHNSFASAAKFSSGYHWSSTEGSSTASWCVGFNSGYVLNGNKTDNSFRARCVREI